MAIPILYLLSGIYSTIIGVGVIGLWTMLLVNKQVPELKTEPSAIYMHIIAETTMAILCLISGFGLFFSTEWSIMLFFIASGFVVYSVINSSGYYIHRKEWSLVIMFVIIFVCSITLNIFAVNHVVMG